jgi:hypothetical protein
MDRRADQPREIGARRIGIVHCIHQLLPAYQHLATVIYVGLSIVTLKLTFF